jgi:integrase
MSDSNSTTPAPSDKPDKPVKPYAGFPLFPHATKRWAKKIRGRLHYFGSWSDGWQAALDNYLQQKDALHAGKKPRPDPDAASVKDLANGFLNHKKALLDAGELSPRTWKKYADAAGEVVAQFGKARLASDLGPQDFAALRKRMASRWGPHRLGDMIQQVRSIFKHAYDAELIDRPVRFGPGFARPSKKQLRLHRAQQGPKLFTAEQIRRLIDAANPSMRAMILLAINAGMGNSDCGNLPLSAVDLQAGWIDYPRPKTGMPRRSPLWPEAIAALREALAAQPTPQADDDAFFVTRYGSSWAKDTSDDPIAKEMAKLLKKLGINGRKGLGFYTLRHTFRTVADESKDQPAVDFIMGHEVPHMSSIYRETISDARLRVVAEHVRRWLFPSMAFVKSVE